MRMHRLIASSFSLAALVLTGCHLPGKPTTADIVPRPDAVTSFEKLYGENCSGCHGIDGQNGAATNLANPEYEALIDDNTLRDFITNGEKGTLMPAFGLKGGGNLTDNQINSLMQGIRAHWFKGNVLQGHNAPPYKATGAGNPAHGQQVYTAACARCHGASGQKPGPAGNILDGSFLALINDQTLRTTIIAGRPEIGQPDWRGDVPGHPLTDGDVTDVTAWILAQRPPNPGQPYPNTNPASQPPGEAQPHAPSKPGNPPGSPQGAS